MFASLIVASALTSNASDKLEISGFRSGLACTHSAPGKERKGWICQPTELVLITDQGTCVYDGKNELCTWHGFEFDYSASRRGVKLQCVSHSDQPADEGNPEKVKAEAATSTSYELELPDQRGHIYNPQYYLFQTRRPGDTDLVESTECSHEGKVVLKMRFRFRFPTLAASK